MWIGSLTHNGTRISEEQQKKYPAIIVLAKVFSDFQNGIYQGEWNQNLPINAGELRDALAEIGQLIKEKHRNGK